jgi:hypothetical protein
MGLFGRAGFNFSKENHSQPAKHSFFFSKTRRRSAPHYIKKKKQGLKEGPIQKTTYGGQKHAYRKESISENKKNPPHTAREVPRAQLRGLPGKKCLLPPLFPIDASPLLPN